VFFVLRWCIAHQGRTEAYGGYDELLHGFWGNQLNRSKLLLFLGGKASISILLVSSTLAPVIQATVELGRVWRNIPGTQPQPLSIRH
jgi:hypothetical protein